MLKWALDSSNGVRGIHTNEDTGWEVLVGWRGLKKATGLHRKAVWLRSGASGREGRRNIEVVPALLDLLRTCIRHESERPLKGDRNVRAFHHFAGVIDLDGELRRVRLTVRETPDGQRFYDHISERTENLAVMANAGSAEEATLDHTRFSAIEHLIGGFHYRDQRS